MVVFRVFSVLAAALLVAAVAVATLAPSGMSVLEALNEAVPDMLDGMRHAMTGRFGAFVMQYVVTPLLIRPLWLLPTSLGLVCVGVAASCFPSPSGHTKRRRS
jgi:hypothetical protein